MTSTSSTTLSNRNNSSSNNNNNMFALMMLMMLLLQGCCSVTAAFQPNAAAAWGQQQHMVSARGTYSPSRESFSSLARTRRTLCPLLVVLVEYCRFLWPKKPVCVLSGRSLFALTQFHLLLFSSCSRYRRLVIFQQGLVVARQANMHTLASLVFFFLVLLFVIATQAQAQKTQT